MIDQFMALSGLPVEILNALNAVASLQKRVVEYEAEKSRLLLESQSNGGKGVKALGAKNMLAQLPTSPLADNIKRALLAAETKLAAAKAIVGPASETGSSDVAGFPVTNEGAVQWMTAEVAQIKSKYVG